jgi:hypothetical protein
MRSIGRHISPATVLAGIALFVSLGGVSYAVATGSIDSREIKNNDIRSKDVRNRILTGTDIAENRIGGGAIKESSLETVPSAEHATEDIKRWSQKLAAGESKELLKQGPFTLTAQCIDNGTDNGGTAGQDIARIVVATTEDGSLLSGADELDGGPAASDFLNTSTVETDRVLAENSVANGDVDGGAGGPGEYGFVAAPSGAALWVSRTHSLLGVNVFGAACTFQGYALTG